MSELVAAVVPVCLKAVCTPARLWGAAMAGLTTAPIASFAGNKMRKGQKAFQKSKKIPGRTLLVFPKISIGKKKHFFLGTEAKEENALDAIDAAAGARVACIPDTLLFEFIREVADWDRVSRARRIERSSTVRGPTTRDRCTSDYWRTSRGARVRTARQVLRSLLGMMV